MRYFFYILTTLDIFLVLYLFFQKNYIYLLNTQIAMIASLFVTLGSFLGYKRVVQKRYKDFIGDDRDTIDKIEDRFDLYKESQIIQDHKKLFEEEKKRVKSAKEGIKNFILTSGGFLSFYRIGAYLFLIISVLFLMDKKIFNVFAYFIGLSLVPMSALIASLFFKK